MKAIDFIYLTLGAVAFLLCVATAIIGQGWVSITMFILAVILWVRTILS